MRRAERLTAGPISVAILCAAPTLLTSCGGGTGGTAPGPALPSSGQGVVNRSPAGIRAPTRHSDWASFGYDLGRTGYNPHESKIGVSNVGSLQEVWSFNVGSVMVHEPVYAHDVNVHGTLTNIIYTGSNVGHTMYALNAKTGAVIWKFSVPYRTYNCEHRVKFSIGETPAIDRGKNLLYFSDGHNRVHALDLATGLEARGWPLGVAEWRNNFMHGGFTYNPANGLLYGVTSSPCDISPWYGRIFVIDTNVPALVHKFFPMSGNAQQGTSGGGIWGPGGAAIDAATNHVFIATGNADTHLGREKQNAPYAEQIIELSPRLDAILANNYPTNIPMNGMNDFDFGATPLLFRPPGCPPLLAALNKSGMFELYDRKTISNGPIQYIAMAVPSNTGSFIGTPAYDPETGYVYVGLPSTESIYHPGMAAFSMASNCTLNPTPVWSAKFGPEGDSRTPAPRSPISIANGVVYISNYTGETEYAFDAATGAKLWRLRLPFYGRQGTVIADGLVFVSSSEGTISAWATGPDAQRLRKRAVQRNVPVGSPDVSIPDGMGGTIDLRTSFNALANFGQQL